ncbi:MAG: ATP-binding protein [Candidatus Sumerlaeota bacterium]|nr:ATP-binding protein [Candidatus Sumerlaeota bacterium]
MPLSLKTKTIIIWLAMLLALASGLTLLTVLMLSFMRDRLVKDAVRLAEEQVNNLQADVVSYIKQSGAVNSKEIQNLPSVTQRIDVFHRDLGKILSVKLLNNEGEIIFEPTSNSLNYNVETIKDATPIVRPIIIGEHKIGDLKVMLSNSKVLRDIQSTSWFMSLQMIAFLSAMTLILAALTVLLWRMFRRHLNLVQRQNQIEHMAYVGTLASGLAHEIRNPLNAMNLNLQIVEEDLNDPNPESPARIKTASGALRNQIKQLNITLSNFLSFALPRGRARAEFDLVALIREVQGLLQPEIERHGVRWVDDLPAALALHGEPAAYQEVLVNLILNGLQAMERGLDSRDRKLFITARAEGGMIRLEIADSGPGISAEDIEHIFDVFFSTREGGAGLGLAIVKRIIEDHGGTIRAGNHEDGGACFVIIVPA